MFTSIKMKGKHIWA